MKNRGRTCISDARRDFKCKIMIPSPGISKNFTNRELSQAIYKNHRFDCKTKTPQAQSLGRFIQQITLQPAKDAAKHWPSSSAF